MIPLVTLKIRTSMYLCIVVKYLSALKRHQTLLKNRWLHKRGRGEAQSSYERAQSAGRGTERLGEVPLAYIRPLYVVPTWSAYKEGSCIQGHYI